MTEKPEIGYSLIEEGQKNGLSYNKGEIDSKFNQMNLLIYSVVILLVFMVATLIIDSFHFNSSTYKEYSQRLGERNAIQKDYNNKIDELIKNQQEILDKVNQK